MTFQDLYYITVIAEEKSITRAANRLYMAQPALSQYLKKVEKEQGILVFERSSTGVTPTEEGQIFLEFAQKAVKDEKNMQRMVKKLRSKDEGEIRLGFTGAQAVHVLPHILPDFHLKYPQIKITLVEENSLRIEQMLENRELDAAFIHPPVDSQELEYFEFSRDEMVVVPRLESDYEKYVFWKTNDKHQLRPYIQIDYLRDEPLALTTVPMRSRIICNKIFEKAGIQPIVKLESKRLSTLEGLARVGFTSTILPSKQLSEEVRERGFYYIEPAYTVPYAFVMAIRRNAYISSEVQRLIDEVHLKQYAF